jgi:hypothetical protein
MTLLVPGRAVKVDGLVKSNRSEPLEFLNRVRIPTSAFENTRDRTRAWVEWLVGLGTSDKVLV